MTRLSSPATGSPQSLIRTPDQRVRVFVSSTLQELAPERAAVREAISALRLTPVMFELGARPHPPRNLYRAYLEQSDIFIGLYWQRYGWVAPGMSVSGLEDEYNLSVTKPRLIYIKSPAPQREEQLQELIKRLQAEDTVSYKSFSTPEELRDLVENDLALLLTESFEIALLAREEAVHPRESDRTRPASRHYNLPTQRSALIGREKELAATKRLLLRNDVGLLTFTGPGGSGKTRLAVDLASSLAERFREGVCFVGLGSLSDPDLVPSQIASTLGVAESGEQPLAETLASHLAASELLLLLDNCEHVLESVWLVSDLLQHCQQLKILATSRTPLRVHGEMEFPVGPLGLPPDGRRKALQKVLEAPAVRLFVQRAQDVKPDFELGEANAAAVADICRRLDGLPLAIELASARIKILTPQAMLARLSSRLSLLTGGARDLPARQQTLRNTIEWSHDLLNDDEKSLFRRMAVFMGGRTLEAIEAVCAPETDLLDTVGSLVDKNLVKQEEGVGAEPRFIMLETVHEYARERLEKSGELEELRRRHAHFFLQLAETANPELKRAQQALWFQRLEEEHANMRAALVWCQSPGGEIETGLRIAAALGWFWEVRGYLTEGRQWITGLMARTSHTSDPTGSFAEAQARVFGLAGNLADSQGDYAAALSMYEESLGIWRARGDTGRVAGMLNNMGVVAWNKGDLPRARALMEESLATKRQISDKEAIASTLSNLGLVMTNEGDFPAAQAVLDESLVLFQDIGDAIGVATSLVNLGTLSLMRGDLALAKTLMAQALRIFHEVGDVAGIAECLEGLAGIIAGSTPPGDQAPERLAEAARLLGAAEVLREEAGVPLVTLERQRHQGYVTAVRAHMDEETFARLWAEGRAMPAEEAVDRALAGA